MRLTHLRIENWRAFACIDIEVSQFSPVGCMLGANGAGKSQIIEAIAACAQQIGLAPGFESNRPSPFGEAGLVKAVFYVEPNLIPEVELAEGYPEGALAAWDRTLVIDYTPAASVGVTADKSNDAIPEFAQVIVRKISSSKEVHYLSLDADRSYPRIEIPMHEMAQVYSTDWASQNRYGSYKSTKNLYHEWSRYFVGHETQSNNNYAKTVRTARENGNPDPEFVDIFQNFKSSFRKILPHIRFIGIDEQTRALEFKSSDKSLSFEQLSGGEREIAFIVGQIDRFALSKGMLLIDEPELHLNTDLLRRWVGFLKDSVQAGQIWFATHSLEVAEVCGSSSSFLIEKSDKTGKVEEAKPLSKAPILSALSRALGSPAFSITGLRFVLIEGEERLGERERYRQMTACSDNVRFIESGSCTEVQNRLLTLQKISEESENQVQVRAVIDRDWRTKVELTVFEKVGVFVLPVHEIENFFLDPETIMFHLKSTGSSDDYFSILQAATDRRAGAWIFDGARTHRDFRDLPPPAKETRELVYNLTWSSFDDIEKKCGEILRNEAALKSDDMDRLQRHLIVKAKTYARLRSSKEDLWRRCEGKEIFADIVKKIGFSDQDTAQQAITHYWKQDSLRPVGLSDLRAFIEADYAGQQTQTLTHPSSTPQ